MKIYLATDHAGVALKDKLKLYFEQENKKGHVYDVVDMGAYTDIPADDYPVLIHPAIEKLTQDIYLDVHSRAIIFGGSGQGEAMIANRHKGVRATVYYGYNLELVKLGREHNNANVLSIGARYVSEEELYQAVYIFLNTPFDVGSRHMRRIAEIDNLL